MAKRPKIVRVETLSKSTSIELHRAHRTLKELLLAPEARFTMPEIRRKRRKRRVPINFD